MIEMLYLPRNNKRINGQSLIKHTDITLLVRYRRHFSSFQTGQIDFSQNFTAIPAESKKYFT